MQPDETKTASFTEFVSEVEIKLRSALTSVFGAERGREAAAEALAYGGEHWDDLQGLDSAAGYLYLVAHNHTRSVRARHRVFLPHTPLEKVQWVEPGLPEALARLPERQRVAVYLVFGHEWSIYEVATFLGASKTTVQNHLERGRGKLLRRLGGEGVRTQIRDYAQAVDAEQGPLTLDEITELRGSAEPVRPINPLAHPAKFRPRRRWLVAVATASSLVVAALLTPLVFSGSNQPDVPTIMAGPMPRTPSSVSTILPRTPSSVPTSLPRIRPSLTWSWVARDQAIFGGEGEQAMSSVTAGGPGLVAVGSDETIGDEVAAVWTSVDGITWSRVPHDEAIFGGEGHQAMFSVTAGGPGLVAVGSDETIGDEVAAVWTSVDGITWSRVPHDEAIFGGEGHQAMFSVTAGGPGLVAVGSDETIGDEVAAVWTSVDGITWSRVPHDEAIFGGEGHQAMFSVTAGGPGLVAVGWDLSGGVAAVWTSVDGITWSRVPHDEAIFGGRGSRWMDGVTVGGPGLVAVGVDQRADDISYPGADAAVWTSADGITWSRVPHDEAIFGGAGNQRMFSVTVGGPGLVAVGFDVLGYEVVGDPAVWTSADGITWSRILYNERVLGGTEMFSVTVGGPGLVAVGIDRPGRGSSVDVDAAVWSGTYR